MKTKKTNSIDKTTGKNKKPAVFSKQKEKQTAKPLKYWREEEAKRVLSDREEAKKLLSTAKRRLPELKALLTDTSDHWGYEDPIYRFYHQSFKVYSLQAATLKIVEELQALAPHLKLDPFFLKIVAEGTGKQFNLSHNANWLKWTRPMVEAFFHAHHMLQMVCKYAEELQESPSMLPSGWATVRYLYNIR